MRPTLGFKPGPRTLALLLVLLPFGVARAEPRAEQTRIGVLGGWRYSFNGAFLDQASAAGVALERSVGGPSLVSVFGYRPSESWEVGIELGFAYDRWGLPDGSLQLYQMPVGIVGRWSPWSGTGSPYLGFGFGYLLNFVSNKDQSIENHTQAPCLMLGSTFDLSEKLALLAEYRFSYGPIEFEGLGRMQTGGHSLFVGVQMSFPPEEKRRFD